MPPSQASLEALANLQRAVDDLSTKIENAVGLSQFDPDHLQIHYLIRIILETLFDDLADENAGP